MVDDETSSQRSTLSARSRSAGIHSARRSPEVSVMALPPGFLDGEVETGNCFICMFTFHQLRARRALVQLKDIPLRTRKALPLYRVHGDSALLVLNRTPLNCNNTLLALNWRFVLFYLADLKNIFMG